MEVARRKYLRYANTEVLEGDCEVIGSGVCHGVNLVIVEVIELDVDDKIGAFIELN